MRSIADVGIPKNAEYFRFWLTVAWCAAVWGVAVLILLGLIWWALHETETKKSLARRGTTGAFTAVVPQGQTRAQRGPVRSTLRRDHEPPAR